MRGVLACLIGSMTLAPVNCGGTREDSADSAKKPAVKTSAKESQFTIKRIPRDDEPLVPPINFINAENGNFDFSSDDRARFHAHGQKVCASGCAASRHPTEQLTRAKYLWLLRRFAEQPLDNTSKALESLVYYGRQTTLFMQQYGTRPLDEQRLNFLNRELTRTHAFVSFRIVDEHGVVRTSMSRTRVPLDRRHEFKMEVKDLPPLITSGTVKRVGLHHLWTRL